MAFGADGSMYVAELCAGRLVKVSPAGARQEIAVPAPAGLAVDAANNVYVSANSTSDGDGGIDADGRLTPPGQIWRIRF